MLTGIPRYKKGNWLSPTKNLPIYYIKLYIKCQIYILNLTKNKIATLTPTILINKTKMNDIKNDTWKSSKCHFMTLHEPLKHSLNLSLSKFNLLFITKIRKKSTSCISEIPLNCIIFHIETFSVFTNC